MSPGCVRIFALCFRDSNIVVRSTRTQTTVVTFYPACPHLAGSQFLDARGCDQPSTV